MILIDDQLNVPNYKYEFSQYKNPSESLVVLVYTLNSTAW